MSLDREGDKNNFPAKKKSQFSNYFAIIFFQAISPILTAFLLCLQLLPPAHTSPFSSFVMTQPQEVAQAWL